VPNILQLKPGEILNTIHTATLPDGKPFEPDQLALVEIPVQFSAEQKTFQGNVENLEIDEMSVALTTSSNSPAFLVLSDVYYPGWRAYIDGEETKIYQTNYILRGIVIPAGNHSILFEFKPKSFYIGLSISVISLLLLLITYTCSSAKKKTKSLAI
jgi:uncharacterized membrane protein YfhO